MLAATVKAVVAARTACAAGLCPTFVLGLVSPQASVGRRGHGSAEACSWFVRLVGVACYWRQSTTAGARREATVLYWSIPLGLRRCHVVLVSCGVKRRAVDGLSTVPSRCIFVFKAVFGWSRAVPRGRTRASQSCWRSDGVEFRGGACPRAGPGREYQDFKRKDGSINIVVTFCTTYMPIQPTGHLPMQQIIRPLVKVRCFDDCGSNPLQPPWSRSSRQGQEGSCNLNCLNDRS